MEKFILGYFNLKEDTVYTDRGYECAAWYQDILVKAGKYPVYSDGYQYHERDRRYTDQLADRSISIPLPGIVTAADFGARYFGMPVGNDENSKKYVGKETVYYRGPYAHSLAKSIIEGDSCVELLPEFEARVIEFTSFIDGKPCKTYGIFNITKGEN